MSKYNKAKQMLIKMANTCTIQSSCHNCPYRGKYECIIFEITKQKNIAPEDWIKKEEKE